MRSAKINFQPARNTASRWVLVSNFLQLINSWSRAEAEAVGKKNRTMQASGLTHRISVHQVYRFLPANRCLRGRRQANSKSQRGRCWGRDPALPWTQVANIARAGSRTQSSIWLSKTLSRVSTTPTKMSRSTKASHWTFHEPPSHQSQGLRALKVSHQKNYERFEFRIWACPRNSHTGYQPTRCEHVLQEPWQDHSTKSIRSLSYQTYKNLSQVITNQPRTL